MLHSLDLNHAPKPPSGSRRRGAPVFSSGRGVNGPLEQCDSDRTGLEYTYQISGLNVCLLLSSAAGGRWRPSLGAGLALRQERVVAFDVLGGPRVNRLFGLL